VREGSSGVTSILEPETKYRNHPYCGLKAQVLALNDRYERLVIVTSATTTSIVPVRMKW
jgi:hypothetical protein